MGIKLINSSAYVPKKKVLNSYYEQKFGLSRGWIEQRTGIRCRHQAESDLLVSELAANSVKLVIQEELPIDFLICTTSTPDSLLPSTANKIAAILKIEKILCFDLMSGCAGFLQALIVANSLLENGYYKRGIIVAAEKMSIIIDEDDPVCAPIFGDASSAWLVEHSSEQNVKASYIDNDTDGVHFLYIPTCHNLVDKQQMYFSSKVFMDGKNVFKYAVNSMCTSISEVLNAAQMTMDDIDYIIPHQANLRIINAIAKQSNINSDKVLTVIQNHGNIVNASIPLTLHVYKELLHNKNILMTAFGAGFNFGAMIISNFIAKS
ncbi:3-oxoacyl-ACP synthase III family protein [Legionella shakespearei]|uniref:3-oxoacyl-ACP synthase n=1 Tax=Legionella shakespearei DSM 23087 TaxID=1122169 RepID=A0A0W0YTG5_9GAMM|nr:ketoacyl-ACP synthase III [Legionella shakespearei]KTD59934.1 3-oxoacyl-ACP synthase [Legionella shakespearei DSM 23087]